MKKNNKKRIIFLGVFCVLLIIASLLYTAVFNDARFIAPIDMSEYVFRLKDLPVIISGILFALYILYIFALLVKAAIINRHKETEAQYTRMLNPRFGYCGLFGLFGFLGFWTYSVDKTVFPFVFFMFFGFFGFFYKGKMSNTFIDERYKENKIKAQITADEIAFSIIFIATLFLGQGSLMGNMEYTLIAFVISVALSIALKMFLGMYLLYHYDNDCIDGQCNESGE